MPLFAGIYFIVSYLIVLTCMPLARTLAFKTGLVDKPGGRKKHQDAVPLVGGLVIFPAFMVLASVYGVAWSTYVYFFLSMCVLLLIGALDDRFNLAPRLRFVTQFIVAFLIVVPGQATIIKMGDMFGFGPWGLNFMAVPFSIIATVLLVNAINLVDGLDGLSGGKGFVAFFWLAVSCFMIGGVSDVFVLMLIMMGALAGFLTFNMRHPFRDKASVFMGDAGSLTLGLALAWFSITMAKADQPLVQPIAVAWILAFPIWDICGQFARRVREGRHPFDADLNHFHHHFIDAGMPVKKATAMILAFSFLTGAIGVGGLYLGLPEYVLTYMWMACLFLHIYLSMKPDRFKAIIARLHKEKS